FDGLKGRRFDPANVLKGKILIASLNAVANPQLAELLFKSLKRDFYNAVLARPPVRPDNDRLCGLILDELPLSVTPEDVTSLALLRSAGGFVAACAQGISGLDDVLGQRQRRALLANFNSFFYFSSREDQTDEHAMLTLGTHDIKDERPQINEFGDLQILNRPNAAPLQWICPPGALARLAQH